jgi:hypothetical protein
MSNKLSNAISFTAGILVGGVAGYFATKQFLTKMFEQELQEEIDDVKRYYKLLRKEGDFSSPETVKPSYNDVVKPYQFEVPIVKTLTY